MHRFSAACITPSARYAFQTGVARSVAASLARLAADARQVLSLLAQAGGAATRFELRTRAAFDPDRCQRALAQLDAAGLIVRERGFPNECVVKLTPRGRRALRAAG